MLDASLEPQIPMIETFVSVVKGTGVAIVPSYVQVVS